METHTPDHLSNMESVTYGIEGIYNLENESLSLLAATALARRYDIVA